MSKWHQVNSQLMFPFLELRQFIQSTWIFVGDMIWRFKSSIPKMCQLLILEIKTVLNTCLPLKIYFSETLTLWPLLNLGFNFKAFCIFSTELEIIFPFFSFYLGSCLFLDGALDVDWLNFLFLNSANIWFANSRIYCLNENIFSTRSSL